MKAKRGKYLYLYLALVCFVSILAIFIVDGYLGVYDTVYLTAQEREQKIEPDYWEQTWAKEQGYSAGTVWGESVHFRYEIENRTISTYSTKVEASLWKSGEKITDLFSKDITIPAFNKATVDWIVASQELNKAGLDIGGYTIKINQGDLERKIVLSFYPEEPVYPKQIPAPR